MFFSRRRTSSPRYNAERLRRQRAGEERFVEVGPRKLCYWTQGSGRPLVLLHGLGGSAFDWRHNLDALAAAGHRVLAFDLLGAGLSDKPTPTGDDYSLRAQAELVVAALRVLGIGRAVFAGNSYGGGVALLVAQLFPDCVDGLILIDSVCYRQDLPEFVRLFRIPFLPHIVAGMIPTRPITQAVLWTVFGDAHAVDDQLVRDYAMEVDIPGRKTGLVYTARDLIPADAEVFEQGIRRIKAPAQILWGALDTVIPPANAYRLHRDLAGSHLRVFARLGHVPHQESPAEVNRIMIEFLRTGLAAGGGRRRRVAAPHLRS